MVVRCPYSPRHDKLSLELHLNPDIAKLLRQ
jgi:hypothetical protein